MCNTYASAPSLAPPKRSSRMERSTGQHSLLSNSRVLLPRMSRTLEIISQFTGMLLRLFQDREQELPGDKIFVTDLADQRGIRLDLFAFDEQILHHHIGELRTLFGVQPSLRGFGRDLLQSIERHAS